MSREVHNLTFAGLLSLPEWDPRFKRRQMDALEREFLLAVLGAAIDGDPQAVAYFMERDLHDYFSGVVISKEPVLQARLLEAIRHDAEELGMSVARVYFDPDNPSRVVIEPQQEWMPPV